MANMAPEAAGLLSYLEQREGKNKRHRTEHFITSIPSALNHLEHWRISVLHQGPDQGGRCVQDLGLRA